MKLSALFLLSALLVLPLTGCPANSGTQLQQAATASENAAIIVQGFENAEIAAHTQGLVSDADHQFIQQQLATVAQLGKTTDTCIADASASQGAVNCINAAVSEIQRINSSGGLYIKSTTAKADFQVAMSGVQAVLVAIETTLGAPAPAK
jgi:hypothetical protein